MSPWKSLPLQIIQPVFASTKPLFKTFARLALVSALLGSAPELYAQCEVRGFSDAERQVIDAYISFYGRAPDLGGFVFWSGKLEVDGGDLSAIIQEFGISEEFDSRFGGLSNPDLVNNLFLQLFGRDADDGGLNFYVGELESGARTLQSISLDILNGAQNDDVTIVSNRALVSSHYVTQAESRGQQLGGDTIFTVLESVGADMASADNACDTVTAEFSTQQESVAATLSNLNISTEKTNRVDEKGEDLPEDYAPLGSRKALGGNSEIYLAGLTPLNSSDESSLLKYSPASGGQDASTLHLPGFSLNTDWKSSPYNAVASGDVDGDGFEELAQLWWNATNNAITLNILDDESQSFEQSSPSVLITANPTQLQVIMADVDADGEEEIVIAIVEDGDGSIEMYVLEGSKDSGFSLGSSKSFAATQADSTLTIEMEAGQLDRDGGEELVVVVSETWGSGQNGSPRNGQAHYYIFDDLKAGLALRATDRISAFVDGSTRDGVTGTVAVGDIDGDNLDEVVVAALSDFFPTTCEPVTTLQVALDDLVHDSQVLASSIYVNRISNCESSGNKGWTSYLWADALDVDGDGFDEVHVNGVVFDDFSEIAAFEVLKVSQLDGDVVDARIDDDFIFTTQSNNGRLRTQRDNTVMTVADVTGDGNDDILVYMPGQVPLRLVTNDNSTFFENGWAVTVWGIDAFTGEWGRLYSEELEGLHTDEEDTGPPVIAAVNVDNDTTFLKYKGEHQVVFTEPIVLAALAAPPCWGDGVQVTDVCQTSWGTGSSVGANASVSHEVSARFHTGFDASVSVPIIGDVGVQVRDSVGVSLGVEASVGYQTTRTITYTTGPMEDTVVATVIPYDQYTYTILSHPVYPDLVGTEMVVSLPRAPRTIQIERQFFNSAVTAGGAQVGSEVFDHQIGDVNSYPRRSDMLEQVGILGSRIGPVDVGASSGSTSVEISEELVAGLSTSVTVSFEREVEVDAGGTLAGFAVGQSSTATLGVSVGSSVVFTGTVGDMPPETFSLERGYSYGLFAYSQKNGLGQQFQVINYWVE